MDYEQKYKEALDWMRSVYSTMTGAVKEDAEHYFPELKESEDERIRKEIITYLSTVNDKELIPYESWIAWLEKQGKKDEEILVLKDQIESLNAAIKAIKETHRIELEKQGEQKPFARYKVGDTIYYNPSGRLVSFVIANIVEDGTDNPMYVDKGGNSVFQNDIVEQKSVDKVEPKFHEGEWITNGDYTWKIVGVKPLDYILQSQDGNIVDDTISHVDEQFRYFTVQDAKDGDVLADSLGNICIYQEPSTKLMYHSYCYGNHKRFIDMGGFHEIVGSYPATKEQRDTLEKAMTDAGWEFDFDKKELKKIEQKPVDVRTTGYWHVEDINQKHTLSEEDEKTLNSIITNYESGYLPSFDKRDEIVKKLKSLKDRYTWKPSDGQMIVLNDIIINGHLSNANERVLKGLQEQLKKLKE